MWIWMMVAWAQDEEPLMRREPTWVGGYQPDWMVGYATGGPMDTLTFLHATHALDKEREFRKLQNRSLATGIVLAGLGTLMEIGGYTALIVGLAEEKPAVAATGVGAFLGGLGVYYACSFPFFAHARRGKHPAVFLSAEEADTLIETHNRELELP
jgi:hypothetical protein